MSRFTLKLAERMAADCGLPCKGHELLPVLRAAEDAHNAALHNMEMEREKPAWNARIKRDNKFTVAANELLHIWRAMDDEGRCNVASFIWNALPHNAAHAWLNNAVVQTDHRKEAPYGINFDGAVHRIEQMITTLCIFEMEHLPANTGPKKRVGGLAAAYKVFKGAWPALVGSKWYPLYSAASSKNRKPQNPSAKILLAFAQHLKGPTPYTLANCAALNRSRSK